MKGYLTFLLFIFSQFAIGQYVTVLNSVSGEPVPYATAIFYKDGSPVGGSYADVNGRLEIPEGCNRIIVSCLGYKTFDIQPVKNNHRIFLEEIPIEIEELVISGKAITELGHISKKRIAKYGTSRFTQTGVFIDNPFKTPVVLKSFLFKPYNIKGKKMYRLHFFKKSSAKNLPGEDLFPADIVRTVDEGTKGIVEIDLSSYNIIMPENGIIASIEGLGGYDKNGKLISSQNGSEITFEAFQTYEHINYYQPFYPKGRGWMEENEWLEREFNSRGIQKPDKKLFKAATFGLKVFNPE